MEKKLSLDLVNLPEGEQTAINMLLSDDKCKIKWDLLPNGFYATTHSVMPEDIYMYHANWTYSAEQKIDYINKIREKVLS